MVLKHFSLSVFVAAAILVLLMLPPHNIEGLSMFAGLPIDKVVHGIMFMSLALALIIAFKKQPTGRTRQNAVPYSVALGTAYGALTEMAQHWAAIGRTAEVQDFIADMVGCFAGVLVFRLIFGKECRYN